jgi:hypothetical protein
MKLRRLSARSGAVLRNSLANAFNLVPLHVRSACILCRLPEKQDLDRPRPSSRHGAGSVVRSASTKTSDEFVQTIFAFMSQTQEGLLPIFCAVGTGEQNGKKLENALSPLKNFGGTVVRTRRGFDLKSTRRNERNRQVEQVPEVTLRVVLLWLEKKKKLGFNGTLKSRQTLLETETRGSFHLSRCEEESS